MVRLKVHGMHYNVFASDGKIVGYMINQKFYDWLTGSQSGHLDERRQFFLRGERVGVLERMHITFPEGFKWLLVRVPF